MEDEQAGRLAAQVIDRYVRGIHPVDIMRILDQMMNAEIH